MGQLYIPDKLKVGFQERKDTYTGKLAYVIYYDHSKVLRKQKSWETWRNKEIEPEEFNNEPTEGFVLNKKVGGYKSHFNYRDSHLRVYDPRGFEFEISVPNLVNILSEVDCSRGKGLEGKFVYSWDGNELVLLPINSQTYKDAERFTKLQTCKVTAKNVKPGYAYYSKRNNRLTYLGHLEQYHQVQTKYVKNPNYGKGLNEPYQLFVQQPLHSKTHTFWNGTDFVFADKLTSIAQQIGDEQQPDYAELLHKYYLSPHGSEVVGLFLREADAEPSPAYGCFWVDQGDGSFLQYHYYRYPNQRGYITPSSIATLKDGGLNKINPTNRAAIYDPFQALNIYHNPSYKYNTEGWVEPDNMDLWVKLASGSEYPASKLITYKRRSDV